MIAAFLLVIFGEVVYDNLQTNTTSGGKNFAAPTTAWAQKVSIQNAFAGVTGTRINLRLNGSYFGAASFNVFLTETSGGLPGNVVAILGGSSWESLSSSSNSYWQQSGTATFNEKAAGDYFLMVETQGNTSLFGWSYGANTSAGTTAFYNGSTWAVPNLDVSLGARVETVAVPEPGSILLGLVAAFLSGGWLCVAGKTAFGKGSPICRGKQLA